MKRIYLYLTIAALSAVTACKKDLADRFSNPDRLGSGTTDIVPGLFTQALSNGKIFIQDYGEWYYLLNGGTSITGYAQIAQRYISDRYTWFASYNDLTSGNGFDDYPIVGQSFFEQSYQRLKAWETVRKEATVRSGSQKADAMMFFQLLSLMKYYQSAKLVDLFNAVPYFDAFQGGNDSYENWYPKYDDPKAIYQDIITGLGGLVDSLPITYAQMSETGKGVLAQQDIAFKGDIDKWVKFANCLKLKYLVRIAGVDAAFAKPHIATALTKPLPTADITFPMWYDTDQKNGGGYWMRGLYENTFASFIPNVIMKRLNYGNFAYEPGIDDPRLPVLAMPTNKGSYRGVSLNIDAMTPIYNSGERYYPYADDLPSSLAQNAFSMYNFATFHRNNKMPVYMFTVGELDLLLAEIALKGLANTGKSAGDHLADAVISSTNFWYALNAASDFKDDANAKGAAAPLYPVKPDGAALGAWANAIKTRFTNAASVDDKMEILMQQKYIHLNLLQPYELWTELRRTGHPKLEPFTWSGSKWTPFPERVRYPSSEQQNNTDNFSKVSGENNTTSKIFWVPADRNPKLYWDNYDYQ